MSGLTDKHFKATMINVSKPKENRAVKQGMMTIPHQRENINNKIEIVAKNQMEIL